MQVTGPRPKSLIRQERRERDLAAAPRRDRVGGRTARGDPCGEPAGWGTNASDGACTYHQVQGRPDFDAEDWWDRPEPPETLSVEAHKTWRTVVSDWQVGPEGLPIPRGALESFDLYREAMEETVRTEGLTVTNPEPGNSSVTQPCSSPIRLLTASVWP